MFIPLMGRSPTVNNPAKCVCKISLLSHPRSGRCCVQQRGKMPKAIFGPLHVLRKVWLFFLVLGVAYIMTGSVLLLHRASLPAQHKGAASSLPQIFMAGHSRALNISKGASYATAGVKTPVLLWQNQKHPQSAKVAPSWLASRNAEIRRFRQHRIHTLAAKKETWIEPTRPRRNVRPKGTYIGCFLFKHKEQMLNGMVFYDHRKMSSTLCQKACSESGHQFAGFKFGAGCHCGHQASGQRVRDEDCISDRRLEEGPPCEEAQHLSVYKVEQLSPEQSSFSNVQYRGCFKRPKNGDADILVQLNQTNITAQSCIEVCTHKAFPLAVLSIPNCFCGFSSPLLALHQPVDEQHCVPRVGAALPSHYQVYQTPVQDPRCMERSFLPEKLSRLVALSSFPGAGNTWLRHLIELATGYYTGSFYFDSSLFRKGFKGEKDHWKSGRTVCVKTHESSHGNINMFDAAILLIRNPYRCLVAEFNRKSAGHLGHASVQRWDSSEWPEFVANHAPWWASHILSWLKFGRQVLVVHYEDLLNEQLVPQLRLIASFLNISAAEKRLQCAEGDGGGLFRRPPLLRHTVDPFTPEMKLQIDGYIRTVDRALRSSRHGGLPLEYLPR